jgi:ribulose-phosphate 3-epimerase
MQLYPSLMGANPLNLLETIDMLQPWCTGFHLDTMDGHAVPNIIGGPAWTNAIAHYSTTPVWVHLMVTDPMQWITQLKLKRGSMVDFQYEAVSNPEDCIVAVKKKGYQTGISIAPQTTIDAIVPLLPSCDYVNMMGVNPGFSGQQFMPETLKKIAALQEYKNAHNLAYALACDGGITEAILPELQKRGVTRVAIASNLFSAPDPVALLKKYQSVL